MRSFKAILLAAVIMLVNMIMPFNLPQVSAATIGERLDVPNYRQIWKPWGLTKLGFSSDDIEVKGCALTSLSMVLKYYGVDTDPGELNDWLKANGGFQGGSISWSKIYEKSGGTVEYIGQKDYSGTQAELDLIRSEIDAGYPVMAKMPFYGFHYVVITGYSGSTFFINDPFWDDPSVTLNANYEPKNDPANSIKGIVLIHGSNTKAKVPLIKVPENPKSTFNWPPALKKTGNYRIGLQIDNPFMTVNGTKKQIDPNNKNTAPIIYYNETTLLPLRAVVEEMGGKLEWADDERKITARLGGRTVEMWIDCKTAYLNGVMTEVEVSPKLIGGRTMMPLRFMAETLGCQVDWEDETKKITVTY